MARSALVISCSTGVRLPGVAANSGTVMAHFARAALFWIETALIHIGDRHRIVVLRRRAFRQVGVRLDGCRYPAWGRRAAL